MSVRKRSDNGKWMVEITYQHTDGRKEIIRKTSPVQTKRGAEQFETQLRMALMSGTYGKKAKDKVPRLRDFSGEFIQNYANANNKPSTVKGKEKELQHHLIPFFGDYRLDEIGTREIEQYKRMKIDQGLSPKTINNTLTCLHKLLDVAREWDIIEHVPRIKWLRVPPQKFDFLNFDEAEKLVDSADGMWKTMILVGLKTGLRQGEILELRWADINFRMKTLVVSRSYHRGHIGSPKSGRSRAIPLCETVLDALNAHYHSRGELVFCDEDGHHLSDSKCKRPLWNACQEAGIRRIGWHVLRHSFASHLAMKDVSLKIMQELLGHSTLAMTLRYAHLTSDVKQEAVKVLDFHRTYNAQPVLKIVSS